MLTNYQPYRETNLHLSKKNETKFRNVVYEINDLQNSEVLEKVKSLSIIPLTSKAQAFDNCSNESDFELLVRFFYQGQ